MTWIDPTGAVPDDPGPGEVRISVRRLGHAVIVAATGGLSPTDERAWCDLVLAACISDIAVRMVVVDLSGVQRLTPACGAVLARALEMCADKGRELRVLAAGPALDGLARDGLDRLVTVAADIHRALISATV